jgi:hypothetical protein
MIEWQVSDKLERIWKEAVVAKFEGTIPTFATRDWAEPRKTYQDNWSPDRDLNPGPSEYEELLTIWPRRSVAMHGRRDKIVQGFGGKTRREESTWKTKAQM